MREEVARLKFVVALVGEVTIVGEDGAHIHQGAETLIEEHLDQVMDELVMLEAGDPSIELSGERAEFSVMVDGPNPLEAAHRASALLRSAIHAAGGGTPDWPTPPNDCWSVTLVSVRSDMVPQDAGDLVSA